MYLIRRCAQGGGGGEFDSSGCYWGSEFDSYGRWGELGGGGGLRGNLNILPQFHVPLSSLHINH